jgi:hypothetical protein
LEDEDEDDEESELDDRDLEREEIRRKKLPPDEPCSDVSTKLYN